MDPRNRRRIVSLVLFKLGAISLLASASRGRPGIGVAIALIAMFTHLLLTDRRDHAVRAIAVLGIAGTMIESVHQDFAFFRFNSPGPVDWLCPPWITIFWMNLGLLEHWLHFLRRRPLTCALIGLLAVPASFLLNDR